MVLIFFVKSVTQVTGRCAILEWTHVHVRLNILKCHVARLLYLVTKQFLWNLKSLQRDTLTWISKWQIMIHFYLYFTWQTNFIEFSLGGCTCICHVMAERSSTLHLSLCVSDQQSGGLGPRLDTCVFKKVIIALSFRHKALNPMCWLMHVKDPSYTYP